MAEPELPPRPATLEEANALLANLWPELQELRRLAASQPLLEVGVRLSRSRLWDMQEAYFTGQGMAAWDTIPYYITNTTFMARTYAELIVALLLDRRPHLDPAAPVYVLEVAAGTACFSYYLLKELAAKLQYYRDLRALRVCYVITDFTEQNVRALERNPHFAPYLAGGSLDFAVFRPDRDTSLALRQAGLTLTPGALRNPLVVVANYFFDCVRQDMFRTEGGRLQEARISTYRKPGTTSNGDALSCADLEQTVDYVDASPEGYYADPLLNELLAQYAAALDPGTILLPVGALAVVRNLLALSGDNLALLSSDKGFTGEEYMAGRVHHPYQVHGCISYMVNYDAICRYFALRGGQALRTPGPNLALVSVLATALQPPAAELERTRHYFQERLVQENPINYLYYCQYLIDTGEQPRPGQVLQALLGYLRLAGCDPIAFARCADWLYKALESMNDALLADLQAILDGVYDNYYPNQNQYLPAFWLGRMYHVLLVLPRAIDCFRRCIDLRPDAPSAYFNLGLCLKELDRREEAVEAFTLYLTLAPQAEDAQLVWQHVQELQQAPAQRSGTPLTPATEGA